MPNFDKQSWAAARDGFLQTFQRLHFEAFNVYFNEIDLYVFEDFIAFLHLNLRAIWASTGLAAVHNEGATKIAGGKGDGFNF